MEKTLLKQAQPAPPEMLRTTVAAVGGVRIIYTLPDGRYVGEVTVLGIGPEESKAIVADAAAFLPVFLTQQSRLQAPMRMAS